MGATLGISARIQLLSFLYKVLHVRHSCCSLFHFASSARNRNLVVTPHWTLAMSKLFVVEACGE
jgi:hypothetical protein